MACVPTVLLPLTLPALLDHVLSTQSGSSPTTLVVCSERKTFLEQLAQSLKHQQATDRNSSLHQLLAPTLHNLSTTRYVKLAFCASVPALLAYLTAYDRPGYVHVDESEEGQASASESSCFAQTNIVLLGPGFIQDIRSCSRHGAENRRQAASGRV